MKDERASEDERRCGNWTEPGTRGRRLPSISVHEMRTHASWNRPELALAHRCQCTNVLHFDLEDKG